MLVMTLYLENLKKNERKIENKMKILIGYYKSIKVLLKIKR